MLCSFRRCFSVAAISYGCMAFSNSKSRTAKPKGLLILRGFFIIRSRILVSEYSVADRLGRRFLLGNVRLRHRLVQQIRRQKAFVDQEVVVGPNVEFLSQGELGFGT